MTAVEYAPCSCGVPNCPELGWPHEWDPIAAGDSCAASAPPGIFTCTVEQLLAGWQPPVHRVTAPYVRRGSGYACKECAERENGCPAGSDSTEGGDDRG